MFVILDEEEEGKLYNNLQFTFISTEHLPTLYKEKSSSSDVWTLYQLRNLINRRDVSGPDKVINKLRYCNCCNIYKKNNFH